MEDKIKSLLEQIGEKKEALENLQKSIKDGGKPRTKEQAEEFKSLIADVEQLNDELKDEEKAQKILQEKNDRNPASPANHDLGAGEEEEFVKLSKRVKVHSALQSLIDKKPLDGAEKEFTDIGYKELKESGAQYSGSGFVIPQKLIKFNSSKKDLNIATEGADLVQTDILSMIPFLQPRSILMDLGMSVLNNLVGDVQYPRETNELTFSYTTETGNVPETTPTTDNIKLSPKRVGGFIDVSMQTFKQSPQTSEAWLRNKISREYGLAVDKFGISGDGAGSNPTGILNTLGILNADVGANGGAMTYGKTVELHSDVDDANALEGSLAFLTTPKVRGKLMTTPLQGSGVEGNFIVNPLNPSQLLGYRLASSKQLPENLTKGSGTNLHPMIFGDFSQFVFGMWGGMEIIVDNLTQAVAGKIRFVINGFNDYDCYQPTAFSATQDINVT